MTAADTLAELQRLGVVLEAAENKLRYRAPKGVLTPELRRAMAEHKAELLSQLRRRTELIDLPWPIGYGGLPADEVVRAEANNDRLGIADPVNRRLNVLMWMRCHFRDQGDTAMAAEMREAYHELRHADPTIQELCGLCEYES